MANRIRPVEEKVQSILVAFAQINVATAACAAGVPASTLRYDLNKVKALLPVVLANQKPGPQPRHKSDVPTPELNPPAESRLCPACGGKLRKNGIYWVLNWVLLLTLGWLGVRRVSVQRWRCKACGHEVSGPERTRQAAARRAWWCQVARGGQPGRKLTQMAFCPAPGRPVTLNDVKDAHRNTVAADVDRARKV